MRLPGLEWRILFTPEPFFEIKLDDDRNRRNIHTRVEKESPSRFSILDRASRSASQGKERSTERERESEGDREGEEAAALFRAIENPSFFSVATDGRTVT